MANEVGSIYVSVMPTTDGFTRQMNRDLSGAFEGAATRGTATFGQMFRRVAAVGASVLATLGIARLVKNTIALGVSYNTLEQSSKAAFTTLLGTTEAAAAMQKQIRDFAMTSPFPRQAFIQGTQQLLAFGFEAKKIIPTLSAVQDAVAAAGGSSQQLQDIIFVMAQIKAAGKITGVDLIQFGQRGLNAAQLIGSAMGKTGAQIKAEITAGTLGADQALDALTKGMATKFGGAAQNLKQTWVGATDRIRGAYRDLSSELVAPFVDPNGGGFAVKWANDFADLLRSIQASPAFDTMKKKLELFGARMDSLVQGSLGTFALLFEENGAAKFRAQIDKVVAQFPGLQSVLSILDMLHPLVPAIMGALAQLGPKLEELAPKFAALIEQLLPLIPPLVDLVIALVPALLTLLPPLTDMLIQATDVFIKLAPPVQVLADALGFVASALSSGLSQWAKVFSIVSDGKVTIAELYDLLYNFPGPVGDMARSIGNFVTGIVNSVIDSINAVAGVIETVLNGVQRAIGGNKVLDFGRISRIPTVEAALALFYRGSGTGASGKYGPTPMADGGTVLPRPGGTLILAAERGRAESVVDTGKLNTLLDTVNGAGGMRPIYADGIGLFGWLKEVAGQEAQLVFNTGINRSYVTRIGRTK